MNNISTFNNPAFGSVRAVSVNDEPYFVGKDVAVILGYERPTDAVRKRVDPDDRGVAKMESHLRSLEPQRVQGFFLF